MDTPIVPNNALQRALQKGLAICNSCAPQVEYLESLASVADELQPSVTELRVMLEHLQRMCNCGLGNQGTLGENNNG